MLRYAVASVGVLGLTVAANGAADVTYDYRTYPGYVVDGQTDPDGDPKQKPRAGSFSLTAPGSGQYNLISGIMGGGYRPSGFSGSSRHNSSLFATDYNPATATNNLGFDPNAFGQTQSPSVNGTMSMGGIGLGDQSNSGGASSIPSGPHGDYDSAFFYNGNVAQLTNGSIAPTSTVTIGTATPDVYVYPTPGSNNEGYDTGTFFSIGTPIKGGRMAIDYKLNTATNSLGYDIGAIEAIAFNDGGRIAQSYEVLVKTVLSPNVFVPIADVNAHPANGTFFDPTIADVDMNGNPLVTPITLYGLNGAAPVDVDDAPLSRTFVTDLVGVLASGVTDVRFLFRNPTGTETGQNTYYRELQVIGSPTVPEPASLGLLSVPAVLALRRRRR